MLQKQTLEEAIAKFSMADLWSHDSMLVFLLELQVARKTIKDLREINDSLIQEVIRLTPICKELRCSCGKIIREQGYVGPRCNDCNDTLCEQCCDDKAVMRGDQ